ncbi:MAG: hypothetical protein KIH08_15775 [Candidatus Freyarchaeota archaeon]|nr:hypothetical protein [Candidatus Jordarchaeia archaeon]
MTEAQKIQRIINKCIFIEERLTSLERDVEFCAREIEALKARLKDLK